MIHNHTLTEWVFIIISLLVAGLRHVSGLALLCEESEAAGHLGRATADRFTRRATTSIGLTNFTAGRSRAGPWTRRALCLRLIRKWLRRGQWFGWRHKIFQPRDWLTDQYFVDGLVNAIAAFIVRLMSPLLRAAQTGFTQNYALVMVLGLVLAVVLFFGADITKAFRAMFAIGLLKVVSHVGQTLLVCPDAGRLGMPVTDN